MMHNNYCYMLLIMIQQGVQETAAILHPCLTPTSIGLDTEFGCFQEKGGRTRQCLLLLLSLNTVLTVLVTAEVQE